MSETVMIERAEALLRRAFAESGYPGLLPAPGAAEAAARLGRDENAEAFLRRAFAAAGRAGFA